MSEVTKRMIAIVAGVLTAVFIVGFGVIFLMKFLLFDLFGVSDDSVIKRQASKEKAYLVEKYDSNFESVYDANTDTLRYIPAFGNCYVRVWEENGTYQDDYKEQEVLTQNRISLENSMLNNCLIIAEYKDSCSYFEVKYTGELNISFLNNLLLEGNYECNFLSVIELGQTDAIMTYKITNYNGYCNITDLR